MIDIERQIAQEFAAERFPGTFEDVRARRVRRRKARWAVTASAAVATVAAVATGFAVAGPPDTTPPTVVTTADPSPSAMSSAEFDAACAQEWNTYANDHQMPGALAAQPPLRIDARSGDRRFRVYATGAVEMECELTAAGEVQPGFMTGTPAGVRLWSDFGRGLPAFGSFSVGGADAQVSSYYVGHVPAGTSDITAHVPGAPDIDAVVDGDLFLIWQPRGRLDGAVITARSQRATVVDAMSTYENRADNRDATIDAFCRRSVASLVDRAGPVLSGVSTAATTVALKGGQGDRRIWVYRRGNLLVPCDVGGGLSTGIGAALLPDSADEWRVGGHVEVMADGVGDGWRYAFGVAPDGMTGLTVHQSDGTTAAAVVRDGYFLAVWRTADVRARLAGITATVDGTRYRIGADGTVSAA